MSLLPGTEEGDGEEVEDEEEEEGRVERKEGRMLGRLWNVEWALDGLDGLDGGGMIWG